MGRVAEVLSTKRVNDEDGHGVDVTCDPGGGQNVTAALFAASGDDSPPLRGDFVALEDSSGTGVEHVVGCADVRNAGTAANGEKRLFARDANGAVKIQLWLKGDGTLVIGHGNGSIEMAADGAVTINGLVIDPDGNVTTPGEIAADGEVTAMAASPGTSVKVSTHLHPHPMGPTSAPQPGT